MQSSSQEIKRNLKIRLATFNMGNSLPAPRGDLSEFLGDLSAFPEEHLARGRTRSKRSSSSASSFFVRPRRDHGRAQSVSSAKSVSPELPRFPLTAEHPYHIIVVCGQECPTARSGGVFRGQSWTSQLENYLCGGADESDSSDEEEEGGAHGPAATTLPATTERDRHSQAGTASPTQAHGDSASAAPYTDDERSAATSTDDLGSHIAPSAADTASVSSRTRQGPYVLVEKERLMGIYCAVFVARCCEALVEGVSSSRVTAGLIGGRVGNKGGEFRSQRRLVRRQLTRARTGVGISLHFASTRLLFVSAHLAAHASGLEIRKANAQKILDELDLDDFLGPSAPRSKKLIDRFDHTFFMGDLNFRLNISRLHADWLVQARDFATAMQFDQLRAVLAEADCALGGFGEAPIFFAPTYKYDLRRTARRVVKKPSRLLRRASKVVPVPFSGSAPARSSPPEAVADPTLEAANIGPTETAEDDAASIASTIDAAALDALAADSIDLSAAADAPGHPGDPVRNARVRFLTLVKRNSTRAALETARIKALASGRQSTSQSQRPRALAQLFQEEGDDPPSHSPRPILQQSQSAMTARTVRPGAPERADGVLHNGSNPEHEAVWDSSKKQRVQSWTDRILFYPNRQTVAIKKGPPSPAPALVSLESPSLSPSRPSRSRSVRSLPDGAKRSSRSRTRLRRQVSQDSLASGSVWQRVKSFPSLSILDRKSSIDSTSPKPPNGPPLTTDTEPVTGVPSRRPPRRRFTLSASSDSSSSGSPPRSPAAVALSSMPFDEVEDRSTERSDAVNLPRVRTFASALSRFHERHAESSADLTTSLNNRLRTFLTSLPVTLPFLSAPVVDGAASTPSLEDSGASGQAFGPQPGELMPIEYNSVMDIERMGAVSDHRPVYLVCALGIEES